MRLLRVAIIDDDTSLRVALAGLLRSHGHHVFEHASAETFLNSSDVGRIDCIVSDIHMPDMNGIELKQRLNLAGDHTPVVLMTGRTYPGLEAQVTAAGAYGPLAKPFEATALLNAIAASIRVAD